MHPRSTILNWSDRFRTAEEDAARATNSIELFWRRHDPFCDRLLTTPSGQPLGRDAAQFIGTFFPFYRKASLLGLPRDADFLSQWLLLAFLAGHVYGEQYGKDADGLFEHERSQGPAAWSLLTKLQSQLEGSRLSPSTFSSALDRCCDARNRSGNSSFEDAIIANSQNCIWAGMLAATGARNDIVQLEFLERVRGGIQSSTIPLHYTAMIRAPLNARSHRTSDLLLHPLLDVAAEKYVATPLEGSVILSYFNQQLRCFGRKGEADCPVEDLDLVNWIGRATIFARQIADTDRDLLAKVFLETGHSQLRAILKTLNQVLALIEDDRPSTATTEILRWHKRTYGWSTPEYYGDALELVVQCTDMAIWLAWAPELGSFPDVSSKKGMSM